MFIDERPTGGYVNGDWRTRNGKSRTWVKGSDDENTELEQLINGKLNGAAISDYAPKWFTGRRKDTKMGYRRDLKSGAAR